MNNNNAQLLGISNDEDDVLGAPEVRIFSGDRVNGQYIEDVMYAIYDLGTRDGGTIYLSGGNYYSGWYWNQKRIPDLEQYQRITIKNVEIIGGSPNDSNKRATLWPTEYSDNVKWPTALSFSAASAHIPGSESEDSPGGHSGFYSTSRFDLDNVKFENITSVTKLLSVGGGSMKNCEIINCESPYQFITLTGSFMVVLPYL